LLGNGMTHKRVNMGDSLLVIVLVFWFVLPSHRLLCLKNEDAAIDNAKIR